jgi:hypothetical protein
MTTSPGAIAEPFASDSGFWLSLRASRLALITLVGAGALTAGVGTVWAITFVVPAAALAVAAVAGRASAERSRTAFQTHAEWRDAERSAVAKAFIPKPGRRSR